MESILIHHGILGQKWGVRRFQNKDGSLTEAGRKRLSETIDPYLPDRKKRFFEKNGNRKAAGDEYTRKLNFEAAGKDWHENYKFDGDGYELAQKIGERRAAKIWNDYLDKYGSATIHDIGLIENRQTKDYVNSLLDKNKIYRYDMIDGNGKKSEVYLEREDAKSYHEGFKIKNERSIEPTLQEKKEAIKQTEKYRKLREDVDMIEYRINGEGLGYGYSSENEKKKLLREAGRKSKQADEIYKNLRKNNLHDL